MEIKQILQPWKFLPKAWEETKDAFSNREGKHRYDSFLGPLGKFTDPLTMIPGEWGDKYASFVHGTIPREINRAMEPAVKLGHYGNPVYWYGKETGNDALNQLHDLGSAKGGDIAGLVAGAIFGGGALAGGAGGGGAGGGTAAGSGGGMFGGGLSSVSSGDIASSLAGSSGSSLAGTTSAPSLGAYTGAASPYANYMQLGSRMMSQQSQQMQAQQQAEAQRRAQEEQQRMADEQKRRAEFDRLAQLAAAMQQGQRTQPAYTINRVRYG